MIDGAHVIIYSKRAAADRALLRDVFELPHVDAGEGWLVFGLPPAELGVHPGEKNGVHELYFMCNDIHAFVRTAKAKKIACSPVQEMGWGVLTQITLPGGGKLGVYEPRHARAPSVRGGAKKSRAPKKPAAKKRAASKR